jgi:hypothetical protein
MTEDKIASSIDAVLGSLATEGGPDYDGFAPHGRNSVELQRLAFVHLSRVIAGGSPLGEQIQLIVFHSFWLGFESGKCYTQGLKMDEVIQV